MRNMVTGQLTALNCIQVSRTTIHDFNLHYDYLHSNKRCFRDQVVDKDSKDSIMTNLQVHVT